MEGIKQSGSNFYQHRVGRSDRAIMEQVRQQKTRDQVGGRKQEIGELSMGGGEHCGAINKGERDWGASD